MSTTFEAQKNRKALIYTAIICICLLLLFILISWKVMPPTVPVVQDLIEINLGNNEEGFGETQPLKKGNRTPSHENIPETKHAAARPVETESVNPDEHAEENAAAVNKPEKKTIKTTVEKAPAPVVAPAAKPQKPKLTYPGTSSGPSGNNPTQDNGYNSQGNNPHGRGDHGDPNGNADSYGNTPGGKTGGTKLVKLTQYYNFEGDLPKAKIFALIKVSGSGRGSFLDFAKGSTTRNRAYADDINNRLRSISFDRSNYGINVIVEFNYNTK